MAKLVALAVREAREELGWSQAELAQATRALGNAVTTRTVFGVETGEHNWRVSTIEAVAAALGTTPTGLILEGEAIARRKAVRHE